MYQFTITLPLPERKPKPEPELANHVYDEESFRFDEPTIELILTILLCVTPWLHQHLKLGVKALAVAGWQTVSRIVDQLKQISNQLRKVFDRACDRFERLAPVLFWQCVSWSIFASIYYLMAWMNPVGLSILASGVWTYALSLHEGVQYSYGDIVSRHIMWGSPIIVGITPFAFAIYAYYQCRIDYHMFLTLGGSGSPQSWNDFKRVTLLGAFGQIDTFEPPKNHSGEKGYIFDIPFRKLRTSTPWIAGIVHQRQITQYSPEEVRDYLIDTVFQITESNVSRVVVDTSFLERNTQGFRAHDHRMTKPVFRTFGGEIAHPHVDGSLHVMLHPADIDQVLDKGWEERHPLARANWWWRWFFLMCDERPPIPEDLVLIYAPRDKDEVDVIAEIVDAAIDYVTGPRTEHDDAAGAGHTKSEADQSEPVAEPVAALEKAAETEDEHETLLLA